MAKAILLTGAPGSGKTTALKIIISRLSIKTGGFYTEEIREAGVRVGFKIITLDGQEITLAHVQYQGQPRIGKYGVNLEAFDAIAVESLQRAQEEADLIIIDEIGPMEILSNTFCQVVMEIIEAEVPILGSIVKRNVPFAEEVKAHPEVTVLELRRENQQEMSEQVFDLLEKIIRES